jgi:hypothetical protein
MACAADPWPVYGAYGTDGVLVAPVASFEKELFLSPIQELYSHGPVGEHGQRAKQQRRKEPHGPNSYRSYFATARTLQ